LTANPVISSIYYCSSRGDGYFGVFNVNDQIEDLFKCCLSDGIYTSEITGKSVTVKNGYMRIPLTLDIVSFSRQKGIKTTPVGSVVF